MRAGNPPATGGRAGVRPPVLALLGAAVVLLAGCTQSAAPDGQAATNARPTPSTSSSRGLLSPVPSPQPVPTGQQGLPRGGFPTNVDLSDPTAVSKAFARASFLVDTRIDVSPFDAARRAARWATPEYAAALRSAGVQPGGMRWETLVAHDGYTTVTATPVRDDGRPADQLRRARRGWVLTITPHGAEGWTGEPRVQIMYLTLIRTQGQWQVSTSHVIAGSRYD